MIRRLALSALIIVGTAAAAPRAARAEGTAVVGGRVVFRDATRELNAQEVERLRWGHITVELRRGWQVFTARPDAAGLFTVTGPPGTYHFEYLRLGELVEFFPPHEVAAGAGRVTCLGTLEVTVPDMVRDLGQNNFASTLRVRDDCAQFGSSLRQLAVGHSAAVSDEAAPRRGAAVMAVLARATPVERFTPSVMEVLTGLRLQIDFNAKYLAAIRGTLVVPLTKANGKGRLLGSLSIARTSPDFVNGKWPGELPVTGNGWGGTLGVGYAFSALEFHGFGGYLNGLSRGPTGPILGGAARIGGLVFGVGVRFEQYFAISDQALTLTLDVSPVGLLGALL